MLNIRTNGKVNLTPRFDQEARIAAMNQVDANNESLKTEEFDKYATIKIIQKNMKLDYDEIISEKNTYESLLHENINNPLYQIEKLSELIGKAKAIKTSKVYKRDRRVLLQTAIDLFSQIKDRLSLGILDQLKHSPQRRLTSDTTSQSNDSLRLARSFSAQEMMNRNIQDSFNIDRKFLRHNVSKAFSDRSDKSESSDSDDEQDYGLNLWSRNRFSSTSTIHSQYNSMQNGPFNQWNTFGSCQSLSMFDKPKPRDVMPTPCIYASLSSATPHYSMACNQTPLETNLPTPCVYASLTNVTPMFSALDELPPLPESPEKELPMTQNSTMYDDIFSGHFPDPNSQMDEIESIQATLEGLGKFDSMDGKSDSDDDNYETKRYLYNDGDMTEFVHPSDNKPNQSINSTDTSQDSPKSDNNEWGYLKLTQENLFKFQKLNPSKVMEKVSKHILDDLNKRLKLISKIKKVEPIKRRHDDADDEMTVYQKSKKAKNPKKVSFKLIHKPKIMVSPQTKKIQEMLN